eukprot:2970914-Amphidinium_carterae.3
MEWRERLARARRKTLDFFSTDYFPKLFLMQTALGPQLQLMSHALHEVSAEWEVEQQSHLQRFGYRSYRLVNWCKAVHLNIFFDSVFAQATSERLWQEHCQTEESRSNFLKFLMRPAAVIHQLVHVPTQGCPYKVFGLLDNVSMEQRLELATDLHATPKCLRDNFTNNFLSQEQFNTPRKLLSENARQVLAGIAVVTATTTYSTERLHSRNLRRAKHRVHTHSLDVKAVSVCHMGLAAPSWVTLALKRQQREQRRLRRASTLQRKRKPQGARRGGGGAFRAYLHHHLQGRKWTAEDMRIAGASYRALPAEEVQRWKEIGIAGPLH